jgi:hypothetical protein
MLLFAIPGLGLLGLVALKYQDWGGQMTSGPECDQPLVLFLFLTALEMVLYSVNAMFAFLFTTECCDHGDPDASCREWVCEHHCRCYPQCTYPRNQLPCCPKLRAVRGIYSKCKRWQKRLFYIHALMLTLMCALGTLWYYETDKEHCEQDLYDYAGRVKTIFWTGFGMLFAGTFLFCCFAAWLSGRDVVEDCRVGVKTFIDDSDDEKDSSEFEDDDKDSEGSSPQKGPGGEGSVKATGPARVHEGYNQLQDGPSDQ